MNSILREFPGRILLPALLLAAALPATAALQDVVGHFQGSWTNTTFGSTGKAVIDIQISGATGTMVFDMDGYVFGMFDPPVINMPGTVQGDALQIDNQGLGLFGDMKGQINGAQGTFSVTMTNIPGGYIQQVLATGTIHNGRIDAQYTVDFYGAPGPTNPAHGVMLAVSTQPLVITRVHRQGSELVLDWTGGHPPYQVSTCSNLTTPVWTNLGASTAATSATVPFAATGPAFFRVSGQP